MKRRAAEAMDVVRLERGEGKDRVFWEISRTESAITTRFGRWLSPGRRVERAFATEAEAKTSLLALVDEKRRAGYSDPSRKLAPGEQSDHGVSAQNAEIEALIEADPASPDGYLVYADWLLQQRDVRGELIIVQHGLTLAPDDAALLRAETTLLRDFEKELLGPIAPYKHIRTSLYSRLGLSWRFGFLRAARLRSTSGRSIETILRYVLEHPSGRFLERLVLGAGRSDRSNPIAALGELAPATLDRLVLGDNESHVGELGGLWTAMPRLRSLSLDGQDAHFGSVRAEALEELVLGRAVGAELEAVARARWPKLESLSLRLMMPSSEVVGALAPILRSDGLPSLRRLTVDRWFSNALALDDIALETLAYAASRRLEHVEIQMPLSSAGVERILAERALSNIGRIALVAEGIGRAGCASVMARLSNVELVGRNERALGEIAEDLA